MNELFDLYQEIILDHNKRPRHYEKLDSCTHEADGHNPLCGDELHLYLRLDGDRITDVGFQGQGCAISKASASMMASRIKGMTRDEAMRLFQQIRDMLAGPEEKEVGLDEIGDLAALSGVRKFHARIKCATLAWHTLEAALQGKDSVTTE